VQGIGEHRLRVSQGVLVERDGHDCTLSLSKGEPQPQQIAAAALFREVLKLLAEGLGPVGEIALGIVADDLFVRGRR
jgi:hypothetical protein